MVGGGGLGFGGAGAGAGAGTGTGAGGVDSGSCWQPVVAANTKSNTMIALSSTVIGYLYCIITEKGASHRIQFGDLSALRSSPSLLNQYCSLLAAQVK